MSGKKIATTITVIAGIIGILYGTFELGRNITPKEVHLRSDTIKVSDTLFITRKVPDTLIKPVFVEKEIIIRDTIIKKQIVERSIENIKYDTIYLRPFPQQITVDEFGRNCIINRTPYKNYSVPEIILESNYSEDKKWWQELIYITATAGITYGITKIE